MAEQTQKNKKTGSTGASGSESATAAGTSKSAMNTGTANFGGAQGQGQSNSNQGLMQQVRSTASNAYETATSKATEKLEEQKSSLSSGLSTVAVNIRNLGENLSAAESEDKIARLTSDFSSAAAQRIERAAQYFDRHDINEMYRDVENVARRNPALFLGGAFALGFLAARFLKSSSPRFDTAAAGRSFNSTQGRRQPQLDAGGSLGM